MPTLVTTTVTPGSLAVRPQPSLTAGDGVLLRPWSLDDAPAVMDAYQDEAIQRWHVMRADSLAETREWIAGWQGGWAAETDAIWAVVDAESDLLLGRAGLKHLKFSDGTADVTYWTVPAARGKDVCPRAVNAMAVLGFRGGLPPARPGTRGRQHGLVPGGREDRLRRRGRASERMAPGRRPVRRPRARPPALSTPPNAKSVSRLSPERLQPRRHPRRQRRSDLRRHRHVRPLKPPKRPKRSKLSILFQLRPKQRWPHPIIKPNISPPPEMPRLRRLRRLRRMLVRRRDNRRDVVNARDPEARQPAPTPDPRPPSGPGSAASPTTAPATRPPPPPGRSAAGSPQRSSPPWLHSVTRRTPTAKTDRLTGKPKPAAPRPARSPAASPRTE